MAYEKTVWVDGTTKLNAEHLNHIEDGLEEASNRGLALEESVFDLAQTKIDKSAVVDVLSSDSATDPLSARQGKALDEKKIDKADVIDSLDSDSATSPISARQGKALDEKKANVDGSYETLHAGTASDLTSDAGLPVSGVFVKAPLPVATGDGLLTISEIRGHTAKVRQQIQGASKTETKNGVTATYKENGTVSLSGTASAQALFVVGFAQAQRNHKCVLLGAPVTAGKNAHYLLIEGFADTGNGVLLNLFTEKRHEVYIVVKAGANADGVVYAPQFIDLTDVYGAGNEPSTVERFREDFPNPIPFSEASLLYDGTASSLVSRDSSGAIVDSLEIKTPPARSAGSAFDSFSFEGKLTRRINEYTFTGNEHVSNYLGGNKTLCVKFPKDTIPFTPMERVANAMWAYGPTVNTNEVAASVENSISMFTSRAEGDFLAVRTDKTADELKAWLKGKHLYYETKNPTKTQAEPFRKAVKVKAGGRLSFEGGNGYPLGLGAVAQKSIKNFAEGLGNEVGWEPSNLALKSDLTAPKEIPLELRDDEGQLTFSIAKCFEEGHWISIDIQGTMTPTSTVITNKALAVSGFLSEGTLARLAYLNGKGTVLKGSIAFGDEALSNAPISFALLNVVKASDNRLHVYHGDFSGLEVGKTYFFNVHGRILLADGAKEAHQ